MLGKGRGHVPEAMPSETRNMHKKIRILVSENKSGEKYQSQE